MDYLYLMKKVIVIVVFLFFLKPILPVLEYVFNYDYIVKELCENKAKPEMKCNGKCHLMKELAKASDTDNPVSQDKKTSHVEFEILFLEKSPSFEIVNLNSPVQKEINMKYSDLYFYENTNAFFHPPTV
ncbi:hypothetical protein [Flavobacterium sp. N1946]|uniref:hypothetical protein n=2 Tax=Flavobacterium TaxID=237 RepID=UPI002223FC3C|nr:hypothetical protein [Flavobacterium sp. N1946]